MSCKHLRSVPWFKKTLSQYSLYEESRNFVHVFLKTATYLGLIVQSISSLTKSLVKDSLSLKYSQTQLCFFFSLKNCEELLHCSPHVFSAKNGSLFVHMFETLMSS